MSASEQPDSSVATPAGKREERAQRACSGFAKEEPVKLVTEILGGPQAETVKEEQQSVSPALGGVIERVRPSSRIAM